MSACPARAASAVETRNSFAAGLLLLLHVLLAPAGATQTLGEDRVLVMTGHLVSVPQEGFRWLSDQYVVVGLELATSSPVRIGALVSHERKRSQGGAQHIHLNSVIVRASYSRWQSASTGLAPHVEAGFSEVLYISTVDYLEGSWRIAPRVGVGVTVHQRLWRAIVLVGGLDYNVSYGGYDGFTVVRGPFMLDPSPTMHYGVYRAGLAWTF